MFQEFYLVFGSILNLFGLKIAIGQSFIILNGQILKMIYPSGHTGSIYNPKYWQKLKRYAV